jgi:hypothetical protein
MDSKFENVRVIMCNFVGCNRTAVRECYLCKNKKNTSRFEIIHESRCVGNCNAFSRCDKFCELHWNNVRMKYSFDDTIHVARDIGKTDDSFNSYPGN